MLKNKEAVYLIDGFGETWDIDDRTVSRNWHELTMISNGNALSRIRDFIPQTEGIMTFEMLFSLENDKNGAYIRFTNSDEVNIFTLYIENNMFYAANNCHTFQTGIPINETEYRLKINFDLDNKWASVFINGKRAGEYPVVQTFTCVSRVVIGVSEGYNVVFKPRFLQLYVNYSINDIFLSSPYGTIPEDWIFEGEKMSVERIESNAGEDCGSLKITAASNIACRALKSFPAINGKVVFEAYILLPKAQSGAYISLKAGEVSCVTVRTKDDYFVGTKDEKLRKLSDNIWQCVRIEADTESQKALVRICGKDTKTIDFEYPTDFFDTVEIGFCPEQDAVMWFDDIDVHKEYTYEGYCPEPVIPETEGYLIGINICSLWRTGVARGWSDISPFEEETPYLGYYDEGIIEAADWEIKWMAEHGINYQHYCWYAPSGNITSPIKKSNFNEALHDGYFNAKYKNKIKFNFMWENTGTNVYSLEQFKEFLWPYWVEYYFTDPCFMRFDNKAVITIWSLVAFIKAFGNEEKALEAVKFMNEDIKKYGYDGLLIFFADGHRMEASFFEKILEIGGNGAYGYHWNKGGCEANHQKYRMSTQYNFQKTYILPAVSVGFNNVAWAGTRSPLISPEAHREVLEFVKNVFLKKYENEKENWKSRPLIISTWNEFGEGTYVMPTNLHGFAYLDNIREVFTKGGDHTDVRPDETQKDRMCYLFPKGKSLIRRYDFEVSRMKNIPNNVYMKWDFSDKAEAERWKADYGAENLRFNGSCLAGEVVGAAEGAVLPDYELDIDAAKADVAHIRIRLDRETGVRLAFHTETDKVWNNEKLYVKKSYAAGEFVDIYMNLKERPTWNGKITKLRIDPQGEIHFEIALLELLKYDAGQSFFEIHINGKKCEFDFDTYINNEGHVLVTANPQKGFFGMMKLLYRYSRIGKTLNLYTIDKEIALKVDSDIAVVNGEAVKMPYPMKLRDGLPVFSLNTLCDILGYQYELTKEKFQVFTDLKKTL